MVVAAVPPGVIERIVEALDPEEVWLFGSRARQTHGPDSDWDLIRRLAAPSQFQVRRRNHLERGVTSTTTYGDPVGAGPDVHGQVLDLAALGPRGARSTDLPEECVSPPPQGAIALNSKRVQSPCPGEPRPRLISEARPVACLVVVRERACPVAIRTTDDMKSNPGWGSPGLSAVEAPNDAATPTPASLALMSIGRHVPVVRSPWKLLRTCAPYLLA